MAGDSSGASVCECAPLPYPRRRAPAFASSDRAHAQPRYTHCSAAASARAFAIRSRCMAEHCCSSRLRRSVLSRYGLLHGEPCCLFRLPHATHHRAQQACAYVEHPADRAISMPTDRMVFALACLTAPADHLRCCWIGRGRCRHRARIGIERSHIRRALCRGLGVRERSRRDIGRLLHKLCRNIR
jgi:hypothetical protein